MHLIFLFNYLLLCGPWGERLACVQWQRNLGELHAALADLLHRQQRLHPEHVAVQPEAPEVAV